MALTEAQKQAQLMAVGWGGPTSTDSVDQAWARTATPADQAANNGTQTITSSPTTPATTTQAQLTNPAANTALINAATAAANQAYLNAKLNLDSEDLAFRKATQAYTNTLNAAALTGTFNGSPTQAALAQQQSALAQQQQNAVSVAGLTGYYNAPGTSSAGGGGGGGDPTANYNAAIAARAAAAAAYQANPTYDTQMAAYNADVAATQAATAMQNAPASTAGASGGAGGQGIQTLASQLQNANLTGMYNGAPTQAALAQQQSTANDYLKLISGLQGPQDYGAYLRTLGSTPGGMRDLVASAAGQYTPASGATTGVGPQAASLGGLVGAAQTGASGGTSYGDYMQTAQGLPAPNQIAPAAWNAYTDSQKKLLLGMYGQQGYNTQDVQDLYNQSLPKYASPAGTTGTIKV